MTNRGKHSLDAMKKEFNKTIDRVIEVIPETPKPVSLKLPKLQKKTEDKLPMKSAKIKLPKLKKVT